MIDTFKKVEYKGLERPEYILKNGRAFNIYAALPYIENQQNEIAELKAKIEYRGVKNNNAAVAAIQYALEHPDAIDFLRLWNEGEFQVLRDEWDDVPEEVFIGADPLHKSEFSGGVLFIYGERACGKTHHSEALRKFFKKEVVIEEHQLRVNKPLTDSCLVLTYGPPVVDEDQDVLSFTQAMSIAGIVSTKPEPSAASIEDITQAEINAGNLTCQNDSLKKNF